eukprot:SAG11_NODE_7733_length_1103_cov_1.034861_1_plen_233_part_00
MPPKRGAKRKAPADEGQSSIQTLPVQKEHWRTVFDEFDRDGNGSISWAELNSMLIRLGQHVTPSEVSSMINDIDDDDDAQISFEEFLARISSGTLGKATSVWNCAIDSVRASMDLDVHQVFQAIEREPTMKACQWLFDDEKRIPEQRDVEIQLAKQPFAQGGMRQCYALKAKVLNKSGVVQFTRKYVAKEYKCAKGGGNGGGSGLPIRQKIGGNSAQGLDGNGGGRADAGAC